MQNPFLIGAKIYLRAIERADAARCVAWLNDPEVTRTLTVRRPLTLQAEEDYIVQQNQDEHVLMLGIVLKETDELIGGTGLNQIDFRNRHACFGLFVGDRAQWGKGHGTEATSLMLQHSFDTLNLNRVWLQVYAGNDRAIHIYEKLGFRREGVLRQHDYRDGRYRDTINMGILRAEWDGERGG